MSKAKPSWVCGYIRVQSARVQYRVPYRFIINTDHLNTGTVCVGEIIIRRKQKSVSPFYKIDNKHTKRARRKKERKKIERMMKLSSASSQKTKEEQNTTAHEMKLSNNNDKSNKVILKNENMDKDDDTLLRKNKNNNTKAAVDSNVDGVVGAADVTITNTTNYSYDDYDSSDDEAVEAAMIHRNQRVAQRELAAKKTTGGTCKGSNNNWFHDGGREDDQRQLQRWIKDQHHQYQQKQRLKKQLQQQQQNRHHDRSSTITVPITMMMTKKKSTEKEHQEQEQRKEPVNFFSTEEQHRQKNKEASGMEKKPHNRSIVIKTLEVALVGAASTTATATTNNTNTLVGAVVSIDPSAHSAGSMKDKTMEDGRTGNYNSDSVVLERSLGCQDLRLRSKGGNRHHRGDGKNHSINTMGIDSITHEDGPVTTMISHDDTDNNATNSKQRIIFNEPSSSSAATTAIKTAVANASPTAALAQAMERTLDDTDEYVDSEDDVDNGNGNDGGTSSHQQMRATKKRKAGIESDESTKFVDNGDDSNEEKQQQEEYNNSNDVPEKNCKRKRTISHDKSLWNTRLNELTEYKKEFGDTNVPCGYAKNKPLANWVKKQRTARKRYNKGKQSSMTKKRIQSLNDLGFVWKPTVSWKERRQQLADYKAQVGNANVPQDYTKNKPLGTWVHNQRSQRKLFEEGKQTTMTKDRIQSLNELGFDWGRGGKGRRPQVSWEERYQQLADYKVQVGNTSVPKRYSKNQPLANWVDRQKVFYRFYEEGKHSPMTKDRIQSLNELGFDWGKRRKGTHLSWKERRQQLADYTVQVGNTNDSKGYSENKSLGAWVDHQRRQHKLYENGKKSNMTKDRIQSLNVLDFDWKCRKVSWEERRQQLADYKTQVGNTNVPYGYTKNKPLSEWVRYQRHEYKLYEEEGKQSYMTKDRIRSLNELGFEWKLKRNRKAKLMAGTAINALAVGDDDTDNDLYLII